MVLTYKQWDVKGEERTGRAIIPWKEWKVWKDGNGWEDGKGLDGKGWDGMGRDRRQARTGKKWGGNMERIKGANDKGIKGMEEIEGIEITEWKNGSEGWMECSKGLGQQNKEWLRGRTEGKQVSLPFLPFPIIPPVLNPKRTTHCACVSCLAFHCVACVVCIFFVCVCLFIFLFVFLHLFVFLFVFLHLFVFVCLFVCFFVWLFLFACMCLYLLLLAVTFVCVRIGNLQLSSLWTAALHLQLHSSKPFSRRSAKNAHRVPGRPHTPSRMSAPTCLFFDSGHPPD